MILADMQARRLDEAVRAREFYSYVTNWHNVFLWWPTEVEGKLTWLQIVERRFDYWPGNIISYRFKERAG